MNLSYGLYEPAVLKILTKTYFENRFFKEHLRRSYGRQRGCSPHQRGSQYPILFQLNSQIPTQLHPYKAKMFHLPPFQFFLLLTLRFLRLRFAKALQFLPFFSSHFASLRCFWTDWQKFFADDIYIVTHKTFEQDRTCIILR